MMKNPVEMIKNEFCERYGLQPEQVKVEVTLWDLESTKIADQVRQDYTMPGKTYDFLKSYKGRNLPDDEGTQPEKYVTCVDNGIYTWKENILDVTSYTRKGVFKNES